MSAWMHKDWVNNKLCFHLLTIIFLRHLEHCTVCVPMTVCKSLASNWLTIMYCINRPIINNKFEDKTCGDGPSLTSMFQDDKHMQALIDSLKVWKILVDTTLNSDTSSGSCLNSKTKSAKHFNQLEVSVSGWIHKFNAVTKLLMAAGN